MNNCNQFSRRNFFLKGLRWTLSPTGQIQKYKTWTERANPIERLKSNLCCHKNFSNRKNSYISLHKTNIIKHITKKSFFLQNSLHFDHIWPFHSISNHTRKSKLLLLLCFLIEGKCFSYINSCSNIIIYIWINYY